MNNRLPLLIIFGTVTLFAGMTAPRTAGESAASADDAGPVPSVPMFLPEPDGDGVIYLTDPQGERRATTINSALQLHLTKYLKDYRSPIAAIVIADARTGSILAMAQGESPERWGGKTHSAMHPAFPAASLFKTVVTTAAFETADMTQEDSFALMGGCSHVRPTGIWLREKGGNKANQMSLRRAFGSSCNSFFAKIAVNKLGLGIITKFAHKYGWETGIPTDFRLDKSVFRPPSARNSSTDTVGRFAAGFGYVGVSAVHAAWTMLTVANDGAYMPMRIFRDSPTPNKHEIAERLYSPETAARLRQVFDASVKGGTASFAFRRGKYRKLHSLVGGKTGTLTGHAPKGLTTWFAGMAPLDNPEVVVAAVVVLEARWFIKGPHLAAEGLWAYYNMKLDQQVLTTARYLPIADSTNEKSQ